MRDVSGYLLTNGVPQASTNENKKNISSHAPFQRKVLPRLAVPEGLSE
jgi:hypothetical protein